MGRFYTKRIDIEGEWWRWCGDCDDYKHPDDWGAEKNGYCKEHVNKRSMEHYWKQERKPTPGNIYIITNPAWPDFIKIGRTTQLNQRLNQYNTGSPFRDYKLVSFIYVESTYEYEKLFKDKYKFFDAIHDDEWYKIPIHIAQAEILKLYYERSDSS